MDSISNWTGKVTATSTVSGQNTLSCSFTGNLGFAVFLSQVDGPQGSDGPAIPANTVAGRMAGNFEASVSTPTRKVTGSGSGEWTVGGTYDPAAQTVSIALRSSGVGAKGLETALGGAPGGPAPLATSFTSNWKWGWPTPTTEDPSTILNVLKPPALAVIPSEREADLAMMNSLPQTGLTEFQHAVLDLKDPKPQMVTQTFQDETGLGPRTTTWVFTLLPMFNIERDDRSGSGLNSFVSTDSIRLRMDIPGVTLAKSGWANLATWDAKGVGPFSGSVVPSQLQHSSTFSFQPSPPTRPTEGSTTRNRPLQYSVSATFEGSLQYFLLAQDDVDLLRQEYIDHNVGVFPPRSDIVERPIDNVFNAGNYNLVVDGGMQAALEKVTAELSKDSKSGVRVVAGFRSPQRNRVTGDVHPNSPHVHGRALDLVPEPSGAKEMAALQLACLRAGYRAVSESAPGKEVAVGSRDARHIHIDW